MRGILQAVQHVQSTVCPLWTAPITGAGMQTSCPVLSTVVMNLLIRRFDSTLFKDYSEVLDRTRELGERDHMGPGSSTFLGRGLARSREAVLRRLVRPRHSCSCALHSELSLSLSLCSSRHLHCALCLRASVFQYWSWICIMLRIQPVSIPL